MKQIIYILAMIIIAFAADGAAQMKSGKDAKPVEFQQYTSYFEKNDNGLKGEKAFLAFSAQPSFDKIFGSAATMGQNSFLPADVFSSKIVVAAIKRGSLRKYENVEVMSEKGKLIVSYTAKDDAPGSATFSSPLIIAVNRDKYKEIVFMENGQRAGTAKIKK